MNLPPILQSIAATALLPGCLHALAKIPPQSPDAPLDAATRSQVIDNLLRQLDRVYVFPDVAKKMEAAIRTRQAKKEFDGITSGQELARILTEDLRQVRDDSHLYVEYSSGGIQYDSKKPAAESVVRKFREAGRLRNYEYSKAEILDGGVGLLQVNGFYPEELTLNAIAGAMMFLSSCDAIILDLRQNHGGSGATLLCSYFFDKPVHLSDTYNREENTTRQDWTWPSVPGNNLADKDLFILTSRETISAPEELATELQGLGRALVVGERTHGGANPTTIFRVTDHFSAAIPFARVSHPWARKENPESWVKPDFEVPAKEALLAAHLLALKRSLSRQSDNPEAVTALKGLVAEKEKELVSLRRADRSHSTSNPESKPTGN